MKTFKYRIYPTKAQETMLEKQLEECRWLYNKILETRKNSYEQQGISLGNYDTMVMIPRWKKERPSLKSVHSQVLQNVNVRVELAYQAFFRRVKAGEEAGYPRFKGYGRYDSICYPQYGNGVRLEDSTLILSKLGNIKIKLHRVLCGTPKTVCVRRSRTGKWFVTFVCVCESNPLPDEPKRIGVDVGLQSFTTLSNGEKLANPRIFKGEQDALAKAQRRMSKLAKNGGPQGAERVKARKVVSRLHERIANKRTDFAHQQLRKIVNAYGVIVFEKLAVVDSVRIHDCPHCGLILDRDHNAAIHILALGLQSVNAGLPDEVVEAPGFSRGE